MEESEETAAFKVSDKRRFAAGGEAKGEPEAAEEEPLREEAADTRVAEEAGRQTAEKADSEREPLPPMDFTHFVLSLANTALFQLGLIKGPESESQKDLAGARQTIDLIAMLGEKTRGNLTDQENKILSETLFQLRMAYVESAK